MQVTNPEYIFREGGRPLLRMDVDGIQVDIYEPKAMMFINDVVYLGGDFEGRVPKINPFGVELEGCTQDPDVVYWQNRYILDSRFERFEAGPLDYEPIDEAELKQIKDGVFGN